ncbi:hypothetical protein GHT06_008254 [Daphnia sinensis]|uniref:Uncharacterized protein n=1 Tax=Daphnia sinensis TaxID=1820382 RepID=A0AAD5LM04_9CRUS|nr:hypothetical protein GHT06_008254 [Daphnia sinensis]
MLGRRELPSSLHRHRKLGAAVGSNRVENRRQCRSVLAERNLLLHRKMALGVRTIVLVERTIALVGRTIVLVGRTIALGERNWLRHRKLVLGERN